MAGVAGYGWGDQVPIILKAAKKKLPKDSEPMVFSAYDGPKKQFIGLSLIIKRKGKKEKLIHEWIKLKKKPSLEAPWLGITKETKKEFFTWLEEQTNEAGEDAKKWFKTIKQKGAARFNQGDAFFARHLGKPIPASKPGKASEPIMNRYCKQLGKKPKKGKK
jgi:hypothetical protein